VAVTGYRLDVRDQIDYGVGRYVNIDRTRSNGLELDGRATITAHIKVKVAYAYTDAIDRSTGARLLRVPEHQGSASLTWTGQRLNATLTVRAEGDQADADPSTFSAAPRKGFVVGDLAGGWKLNDQVEFTARVENVTDETFQQSLGYGETGRAIYVGVRVKN
jgi:vitamin B12 transporter